MMKRIVATLFFLSLVLLALAVVAPGFMNWNAYRDTMISYIQPHVGRKIDVAGDVSFRILPNPQIILGDVTFANVEGGKAPYFMKLSRLEAKIRLGPLMEGKVEVESLNLADPEVSIEMLPSGEGNWTGILKENPAVGNIASAKIDRVSLSNGTLHYINQATGSEWIVEDLRLDVRGDGLFGPYVATGGMKYRDYPVNLEISAGRYQQGQPMPLNIYFLPVEGLPQVKISGTADLSSGFALQADLSAENGTLASLSDSKALQSVSFAKDIATVNAGFSFKRNVIELSDIKASFGGQARASGDMSFTLERGKKPSIAAKMTGENIVISKQGEFIEPPSRFDGIFNLTGKNVTWAGTPFTSVTAVVEAKEGAWQVKNAKASFGPADLGILSVLADENVLTQAIAKTGIAGISVVSGNTDFSAFDAVLKAETVTISGIATGGLSAVVTEAPEGFPTAFTNALKSQEATVFKDVAVTVSGKDDALDFSDMVLANDDVTFTAKGSYDAAADKFDITAVGKLKKPEDAPTFGVTGFPAYKIDVKALEKYVDEKRKAVKAAEKKEAEEKAAAEEKAKEAEEPVITEEKDPPAPEPEASPPAEAIKGILDRLDTPEQETAAPPQPEPAETEDSATPEKSLPELLEDAQMLPAE